VVETVHRLEDLHGLHTFGDVLRVSGSQLALISKDPELTYADLSRAVFLDTETTGLGMGAGTYVFLVGAGYFEPDGFHVKQFFLRGPNEETAFWLPWEPFWLSFPAWLPSTARRLTGRCWRAVLSGNDGHRRSMILHTSTCCTRPGAYGNGD
jgi:hypothetical protein